MIGGASDVVFTHTSGDSRTQGANVNDLCARRMSIGVSPVWVLVLAWGHQRSVRLSHDRERSPVGWGVCVQMRAELLAAKAAQAE